MSLASHNVKDSYVVDSEKSNKQIILSQSPFRPNKAMKSITHVKSIKISYPKY